jgi:hypothetical protein
LRVPPDQAQTGWQRRFVLPLVLEEVKSALDSFNPTLRMPDQQTGEQHNDGAI